MIRDADKITNITLYYEGREAGTGPGSRQFVAIANVLDRQAAELQAAINDPRITVTNSGRELILHIPADIVFLHGEVEYLTNSWIIFKEIAVSVRKYLPSTIFVSAHSDNSGSAKDNFELTSKRAHSVAKTLLDIGVEDDEVKSFGLGEDAPIATNLSEEGRQFNRRLEIIIRPKLSVNPNFDTELQP